MHIVYTNEDPPSSFSKSIFLAGPTPRSKKTRSWRPRALKILNAKGYDGVVFVPENRDGGSWASYAKQVAWEHRGLNMADCILFYVPRNLKTMPAFTTNVEFGLYAQSGRSAAGFPPRAKKNEYLKALSEKFCIPQTKTLAGVIDAALHMIGEGTLRNDGERCVPLHIWRTSSFQAWYAAQKNAGNRLDDARVEFTIRTGPKQTRMYIWGLWVNMFIAAENRHKFNEPVISRPDIFSVVAYQKAPRLSDCRVGLVREFRSPAATSDGFIWELPGGSTIHSDVPPAHIAADEMGEETGLTINPDRFGTHEKRQLAGTLSSHKAHVFSVALSEEELAWLAAQKGIPHGEGDEGETGERTYVEIQTVEEILRGDFVDWTNVGIILSTLNTLYP